MDDVVCPQCGITTQRYRLWTCAGPCGRSGCRACMADYPSDPVLHGKDYPTVTVEGPMGEAAHSTLCGDCHGLLVDRLRVPTDQQFEAP